MKPYVKLASTLVTIGLGLFFLERFGLSQFTGPGHSQLHLGGTVLSVMVIAPVVLVLAGCIVFMVGRMRRL